MNAKIVTTVFGGVAWLQRQGAAVGQRAHAGWIARERVAAILRAALVSGFAWKALVNAAHACSAQHAALEIAATWQLRAAVGFELGAQHTAACLAPGDGLAAASSAALRVGFACHPGGEAAAIGFTLGVFLPETTTLRLHAAAGLRTLTQRDEIEAGLSGLTRFEAARVGERLEKTPAVLHRGCFQPCARLLHALGIECRLARRSLRAQHAHRAVVVAEIMQRHAADGGDAKREGERSRQC